MHELLREIGTVTALRNAWDKVRANGGVAGIDRVTIDAFGDDIEKNLELLAAEVRSGGYRAKPVMRMRPVFLGAKERALVIPTVKDRVVHRAIADYLYPRIDPILSPSCRAFRRGRSIQASADDVGKWIETGSAWVLRTDIRSFFDTIQPDVLLDLLRPFVDPEGLRFLGRIVRSRVFDRDHVADMIVGIPQGSPLSPVLANLYLNELDHLTRREHPRYLRYCDDIIVLDSLEDRVRTSLGTIEQRIKPLGLELNQEKTQICRAEDGFTFLGFQFGAAGRGPAVKAVEALRFRLNEIVASAEPDLRELDALYRGWTNYFGVHPECWCDSPAGVLALLRSKPTSEGPRIRDQVAQARLRMDPPSPAFASLLAQEWRSVDRTEMCWLELASVHGGSGATVSEAEQWAELLDVPPSAVRDLVRRLVGPPENRLTALTEAMVELGKYELAQRLSKLGPSVFGGSDGEAQEVKLEELADYPLLLEWFQGREGVYSVESVSRGHRRFVPVRRPMLEEDWRAHLRGDRTLGMAMIRSDQTTLLGVLDVDISKKDLDLRMGVPDELLGRALGAALKLRRELSRRCGSALLEFSGHKGYHLWIRLAEPAPCREVRSWLLTVVQAAEPMPEGIRVEIFPTRDTVKGGQLGPVIKLPLGIHSKTGKRCPLLDERGKPLDDPFEAIRSVSRLSRDALMTDLVRERQEESDAKVEDQGPDPGSRAAKMLEGCNVIRFVADKASKTSYLTHHERTLLRNTLGHLGEEGLDAIHGIISHCYNYREEVTSRHLRKVPPFPISCPKIRERYPEITTSVGCDCRFRLRGVGYPTPLLHALKPSEVPVFKQKQKGTSGAKPTSAEPTKGRTQEKTAPKLSEIEELITKIADRRRQLRGLEAAIERLREELAQAFDALGVDRVELAMGVLCRVRREGGEGWDFRIEV